jgi:CheY-like chemotaxis protein
MPKPFGNPADVDRTGADDGGHGAPLPAVLQGAVLYIEDEPTSFAVVEAVLSVHPGLRLTRAPTGDDGVRLARAERPDAILLDMHLPDMSGTEVVRRLSEDIAAGAFRVILLTADKLNIDVLKAMSLGAFEYLVKPVNAAALEGALGRALTARDRRRPPVPPPAHAG